jgi:hypothetical protein
MTVSGPVPGEEDIVLAQPGAVNTQDLVPFYGAPGEWWVVDLAQMRGDAPTIIESGGPHSARREAEDHIQELRRLGRRHRAEPLTG